MGQAARDRYEFLRKDDDGVTVDWSGLVSLVTPDLEAIYRDGGAASFSDTGASGTFDQLNELAAEYASERGAEMVGMKWVNGQLVDNPDAEWSITSTTRDEIQSAIERAFAEGLSPHQLADEVTALVDDPARADTIARTELATAQSSGALAGWKASGVVSGKQWLLSGDHDIDDECSDNADDGVIGIDDNFSSGDDAPPIHPNCSCDLAAIVDDGEEE